MQGKTVLITGATNGIGKIAALELAKMGANIVIVGRNEEKCQQTIRDLKQSAPDVAAQSIVADLSVKSEVKKCADIFLKENDRIDVLINNVGAVFLDKKISADGYEMTFALNHLSYFYLTHLLWPLLRKSADQTGDVRVINVSSSAHQVANKGIHFQDIHLANTKFSGWYRYGKFVFYL